jgi:peptide/nickel transport system substrate-binding protein
VRNTKISTNQKVLALATAGLMGMGIVGTTGAPATAATTHLNAGTVPELVMESSPETTITQDFNPSGLIYEPLIQFDLAAPPKNYKWLATGYAWGNAGKSITFTIRSGVKWNDGTPFSAADVAFTFNLLKANPAINLTGMKISSVSTAGNKVTITFPTAQYANLENIAGTAILPEHIWKSVGNPALYTDPTPVGTGPYELDTFTPEGVTLKANPSYWQKSLEPKVPQVYFPVYTSNATATTALFSGQIDWTGNFIPGLQKNFVDKNKSFHHYWEAAGSTNAYWFSLSQWPTNQLAVRQAISAALDRTVIAGEGEDGLENPALNATGLTLPTFAAWSGPVKNLVNSATAQPSKAKAILKAAGYTMKGGFFYLNGKEVTLKIVDPAAYSDYAASGSLAAQELRNAGINASFDGLAVNAWNADVSDGDFQMTEHWGSGGLTPYNMYDNWLDSSLVSGKSASGDFERLNDPALDKDLARVAGDATVAEQTKDLTPLMKYVADELPIVPVDTASEWFEYDSDHFVGFPTANNPYETGQPSGSNLAGSAGTDEVVALHLSPRS